MQVLNNKTLHAWLYMVHPIGEMKSNKIKFEKCFRYDNQKVAYKVDFFNTMSKTSIYTT